MLSHLLALILLPLGSTSLSDLDLSQWRQGYGSPMVDRAISKGPLQVAGVLYESGVGSHAPAMGRYLLGGRAQRIEGLVGMNDSGHGAVRFAIWADGKELWRSQLHRKGNPAEAFSVDLSGCSDLTLFLFDGEDGSAGDHGNWLSVRITHEGKAPLAAEPIKTLRLLPHEKRQVIDNFGASDSWTIEPLSRWSEAARTEIARLLFDRESGAGLSGWRHNLGGGINHETISNPLRTVETYEVSEGAYDWTRNPGKRWMLKAAKEAGVENIVCYAVSPPRRLTRNGHTTGSDGLGTTNLQEGAEKAYARYLLDIVEHYRSEGYPVTHLSPANEPDFEWNPGTQEGNRAANKDLLSIGRAVQEGARARNIAVRLLTPEANSPQVGYTRNDGMSAKYKADYGDYAKLFLDHSEWVASVQPVYAYHSYWADRPEQIVQSRRRLQQSLAGIPGLKVWMTEYCQMAGPRGEGGWGRDLGMTLALNAARLLHFDLSVVSVSAWQWWLAVSDSDYKDGLIYVDDLDRGDGAIFASKTLWVLGQWARFVRPGFQRIAVEGPFADVSGVLPTAFVDPKTGHMVIVLVNTETSSQPLQLLLDKSPRYQAWITSDRPGHDIAPYAIADIGAPWILPSRAVVTLVLDQSPSGG